MVRSKFYNRLFFLPLLFFMCAFLFSCANQSGYSGTIKPADHTWLKGIKIFIDPGHGGTGKTDRFRIGPGGITEEEVNLNVSLILNSMLQKAGADVRMSRYRDMRVPLDRRAEMVNDFQPQLLVSIHHNGSPRRMDPVNYPCVLIWGSRHVRPASHDFARYLLEELHGIMDSRGKVLSDFTVFSETGTRILRKTRYTCPGVIGEAGFFTSKKHATRLRDSEYNTHEAEAYFLAISKFFRRGLPDAQVCFSCPVDNSGYLVNMITDKSPVIALKIESGNEKKGIYPETLDVTLDGIKVRCSRIRDDMYRIRYGKALYPGGHILRFSFRNLRYQSSMIMKAAFTVQIQKGDYDKLVKQGRRMIRHRRTAREGVKMLMAALSMGLTDPEAGRIVADISRGFRITGDRANAEYYLKKLAYFYSDSAPSSLARKRALRENGWRFPVDYHGKNAVICGQYEFPEH